VIPWPKYLEIWPKYEGNSAIITIFCVQMDSNFQVFAGADQFGTKPAATFGLSLLHGSREWHLGARLDPLFLIDNHN
jgi:hypothetical protein